jgi:hypothetical protein
MPIRHQHTMRLYASQLPPPLLIPLIIMSHITKPIPDSDLSIGQDTTMRSLALPVARHVRLSVKLEGLEDDAAEEMLCGNCDNYVSD